MDDKFKDPYEPSQEELREIENIIFKEEMEELATEKKEDEEELKNLKTWLKEHGILWTT